MVLDFDIVVLCQSRVWRRHSEPRRSEISSLNFEAVAKTDRWHGQVTSGRSAALSLCCCGLKSAVSVSRHEKGFSGSTEFKSNPSLWESFGKMQYFFLNSNNSTVQVNYVMLIPMVMFCQDKVWLGYNIKTSFEILFLHLDISPEACLLNFM